MTWVVALELDLHNDGPNVDTGVQDYDGIKTDLSSAALCDVLHVEDEAEAEAANTKDVLLFCKDGLKVGPTYMQKNGEMSEERARARTVK